MPHARPSRRGPTPIRLAVLFAAVALAASSGCQNALSRRWAWPDGSESEKEVRSTTKVEPAKAPTPLGRPDDLPDLQQPPALSASPAGPRRVSLASGTPILDAALAQAKAVESTLNVDLTDAPAPLPPLPEPKPQPRELPPIVLPESPHATPAAPPANVAKSDPAIVPASAPDLAAAPDEPGAKPAELGKAAELPEDLWRSGIERLRSVARERKARPDGEDLLWPVRSRVIDWLAGDEPSPEQWAPWTRVLAALAASDTPGAADVGAYAETLAEAIETLESRAPLQVADLQVCRKVHGFGDVDPLVSDSLKAGQPLIVYCEMTGLRWQKDGDGFRSRLASRVEVARRGESRPVWSQDLGTAEDRCRRRRRDYYVNYRLTLPKSLAPGAYDLRLTQTDLVGEKTTSASLAFSVSR